MRREPQPRGEVLRGWPRCQVGAALADQLQRQGWTQAVDLGQVHPEDRMECLAYVECWFIGLACPSPGRRKLALGRCCVLLQPLQNCLDLRVAVSILV